MQFIMHRSMDKKRAPIDSELFYHSDSRNDVRITSYLQLPDHLRDDIKQVTDKADIRHLEYRCVFVFVDRDDDLGVFHARQMLDRAGDADRDIYFWGYDLAGLANLIVIGHKARVHCGAACANACAKLISQGQDGCGKRIRILQRTAARYDDLG